MAFIQHNDKQIPVGSEEVSIGGHSGATIPVPQAGTAGPAALVRSTSDGKAVIRRGDGGATVKVNGVVLGIEPAPLMHGDKFEVAGAEFTFAEEQKAGSTQFLSSAQLAQLAAMRKQMGSSGPRSSKPTASTGGRLVSLVDGREYPVPDKGLMIGRDASCDVVIPSNDISRNHAEVQAGPDGYYIIDLSTNGVFVNGTRVEGTQTLGRADVIRLGPEEFRFYADTLRDEAPTPAVAQPPVSAAPSPTPEPSAPPPAPPVSAPEAAAPAPVPPARAPAGAPVLATLEIINEGPNKGRKYELRGPLSNVGRGSHNDVVIVDSSVSDQHAKIIRRDGSWYLQDAGSTNGSYVGGKRIEGEVRLEGSPDVRFGSIKLSFRPAAPASTEEKGTKVIAGIKTAEPKRETSETAPGRAAAAPSKGGGGVPVMVWVVLGVVILAAVAFFVMGR